MTVHTTWLLDIDGVVNASRAGWSRAPEVSHAFIPGRSFRMRYEPQLIKLINDMVGIGVNVMLCSTWCMYPVNIRQALGLPDLPNAFEAGPSTDVWQAKIDAAHQSADVGRLVWTDDDLTADVAASVHPVCKYGPPLIIRPRSSMGLRPDDARIIEAYCRAPDDESMALELGQGQRVRSQSFGDQARPARLT